MLKAREFGSGLVDLFIRPAECGKLIASNGDITVAGGPHCEMRFDTPHRVLESLNFFEH
jgi:hypothetical protein